MRLLFALLLLLWVAMPALAQQVPHPAPLSLPVNNTALKAIDGGINLRAIRQGFAAKGDGGQATYNWSGANCVAPDDGAQVQPSATGCWVADFSGGVISPAVWGAKPDGGATDSSAAINAAIAYVVALGGVIDLAGGTYGVCATPVEFTASTKRIAMRNGQLVLQTGCATPPQSVLRNSVQATAGYTVSSALEDLTVDGRCGTKYVYEVFGGNMTTHRGVVVQNPAPAVTIADSAGVYITGGTELFFGSGNWVTATGACYNTGNLPAFGIYHNGGDANFSGVVVVNFTIGIYALHGGHFGSGTHIWGGCNLTGGGCTFDAALRTHAGLVLNGVGQAFGVAVDDPLVAGVILQSIGPADRMVVSGTQCLYISTVTAAQTCVKVNAGVAGSLVTGTAAPQIAAAGFPENIVAASGAAASTIIVNNPYDVPP